MPVANIYFVLGCSKPAAIVSRVPKSNVVTSLFFTMKSVIFKKDYRTASTEHLLTKTKIPTCGMDP